MLSAALSSYLGFAPPFVCTLITASTWILSNKESVKIVPSFSLVAASTSVKLISVPLYVSLEIVNGLLRSKKLEVDLPSLTRIVYWYLSPTFSTFTSLTNESS